MNTTRLELAGQKFGKLTVIKISHTDIHSRKHWLCKCDCGNEKIINGSKLKSGTTKSCGCLRKFPEGIAARNIIMRHHKYNAKRRNLEQALTDEQIIALHKEDCYYCGMPPSNIYSHPSCNGLYTYSGIDRVDNNKGYTIDNVVPCCDYCNGAKGKKPVEDFMSWLKQIQL